MRKVPPRAQAQLRIQTSSFSGPLQMAQTWSRMSSEGNRVGLPSRRKTGSKLQQEPKWTELWVVMAVVVMVMVEKEMLQEIAIVEQVHTHLHLRTCVPLL